VTDEVKAALKAFLEQEEDDCDLYTIAHAFAAEHPPDDAEPVNREMRTAEELQADFLANLARLVRYCNSDAVAGDTLQRLHLLVFCILNIFDGTDAQSHAIDLVASTHPKDEVLANCEGEDWIKDGTILNTEKMLHDLWCEKYSPFPLSAHWTA
jgi:hypothetical protein